MFLPRSTISRTASRRGASAQRLKGLPRRKALMSTSTPRRPAVSHRTVFYHSARPGAAFAEDYLRDRRFKVELALHSARRRVGGLTATTGATPNRLGMLDEMCSSWIGPLVVAVWVPVAAAGVKLEGNYTDLAVVLNETRGIFDRSGPGLERSAALSSPD